MNDTHRERIGYALPTAWILLLVALYPRLPPVGRFLAATAGLFLAIKLGAWVLTPARTDDHSLSFPETVLFWTVWPGVRPDLFAGDDRHDRYPDARTVVEGYVHVLVGALLVLAAVLAFPVVGVGASTWLLLFGVLSAVHFGVGRLLPFCLRWLGYPVPPLFRDPLRSDGVGEFWSDRWNRPFVGMNRLFVTDPLRDRLGIGAAAGVAFVVSGAFHELAISYAAGGGWGGPFAYFVVQAALYTAEHRLFGDGSGTGTRSTARVALRRLWTYAAVLLPLPLLFHAPFRTTFLAPIVEWAHGLVVAYPATAYLGVGLWVAVAGHCLVLVASAQVPRELDWYDDLQSLSRFNRKLLWTYGGFIVLTIVAFAALTAAFHAEFLAGNPVALGLAAFVATFWTARIVVDAVVFDHDDWPEGVEYVVGHAMLTSLFALLVVIYAATVAYHVL